jgi:hypothetical protein
MNVELMKASKILLSLFRITLQIFFLFLTSPILILAFLYYFTKEIAKNEAQSGSRS